MLKGDLFFSSGSFLKVDLLILTEHIIQLQLETKWKNYSI